MGTSNYNRNCPICQSEIFYTTKNKLDSAEIKNKLCKRCLRIEHNKKHKVDSLRKCPSCEREMLYKNIKSYEYAVLINSTCKPCSNRGERNAMFGKIGELNPMFGKRHSVQSLEKMRLSKIGKSYHTIESKLKISNYQKDNAPMRGRSVYSVWLEKYGKEIADVKLKDYKSKQSFNSAGVKNPMFGKPSPIGSGNGYSGWYEKRYFRSLRELMFLVYAKRFNLKIISLEKKSAGLRYVDYTGQPRTYFADYLVNDKYFLEIKPKSLWGTPLNKLKFTKGKEHCVKNNLKFKIMDPPLNFKLISTLHSTGEIKFLPKDEIRFTVYAAKLK